MAYIKEKGKVSLADVAEDFNIPKYGSRSAFSILDSLRGKGLIERKGDYWVPRKVKEVTEEVKVPPTVDIRALVESVVKAVVAAAPPKVAPEEVAPVDQWELARRPMEREIEEPREKELQSYVTRPDVELAAAKKIVGFSTGTFLDDLFLTEEGKPLRGIPFGAQLAITGLPGAGKSILVEEVAIHAAHSGKKVIFATAEDVWKSPTPRFDLQSRLMRKAQILGLDWGKIARNLFIMDTVSVPALRDWNNFAQTYRYLVEREKIDLTIIDSVTVLETYRGALKYRVMELCRLNQEHGVTALYVNQRSAEEWDSYEMAGGIGIAHMLDGTIIVDYGRVFWLDQQADLNLKRGEFVRIVRVLDCRLCNFDRRRIPIEITPDGFVRARERKGEESAGSRK